MKNKLSVKPQNARLADFSAKRDFKAKVNAAIGNFSNYELARKRAAYTRWKAIDNSLKHLIEFEANAIKNDLKVLWAQGQDDVLSHVKQLKGKYESKGIKFNKGDLHNELGLEEYFQKKDWINNNATVEISAANFMFADAGNIVIFSQSAPSISDNIKAHIILASVDSMLPSINDLELIGALQNAQRNAGMQADFTQIVSAPYRSAYGNEVDTYILIVDNNRTDLIGNLEIRAAASCIHCEACLNNCAIDNVLQTSRSAGVYKGPIAVVAGNYINAEKEQIPSTLSTLSGEAFEVCPLNISIHKLVLNQRHIDVEENGLMGSGEKLRMAAWKRLMLKRSTLNSAGTSTKNFMLKQFFKSSWGEKRQLPKIADKSFNEMWRERYPMKKNR